MRNPTTSVTDLVKQIASEEATKVVNKKLEDLDLDSNFRNASTEFVELRNTIDNSVRPNARSVWSHDEETLLECELDAALAYIANKHGRGTAGIIARIKKIGLW